MPPTSLLFCKHQDRTKARMYYPLCSLALTHFLSARKIIAVKTSRFRHQTPHWCSGIFAEAFPPSESNFEMHVAEWGLWSAIILSMNRLRTANIFIDVKKRRWTGLILSIKYLYPINISIELITSAGQDQAQTHSGRTRTHDRNSSSTALFHFTIRWKLTYMFTTNKHNILR